MAERLLLPEEFFNLLPTRYLGVPSRKLVWRGGARPATQITVVMKPPSGGSITAVFDFAETGGLHEITYIGTFKNKVPVWYAGIDPWRVVGEAWRLLPPKSKR